MYRIHCPIRTIVIIYILISKIILVNMQYMIEYYGCHGFLTSEVFTKMYKYSLPKKEFVFDQMWNSGMKRNEIVFIFKEFKSIHAM